MGTKVKRSFFVLALLVAAGAAAVGTPSARAIPSAPAVVGHAHDWDLVNAWWNGQTLTIIPNWWGRNLAQADAKRLLNDAMNKAGWRALSGSQYNSMLNQLKCHAYFADSKYQWNLDAWRPDVGFWSTVRAYCNPQ